MIKCCKCADILRDKTIDDKLIYIFKEDKQNTPSVDYIYCLKCLDTASLESMKQNSINRF